MPTPKIYTRTGDKGYSGLLGNKRYKKSALVFEVVGSLDELNSCLGIVAVDLATEKKLTTVQGEITAIQNDLFLIGSLVAGLPKKALKFDPQKHLKKRVDEFEACIDEIAKELPELRNFILPGGSKLAAHFHLARSICRRCERLVVELPAKSKTPQTLAYLNRLSDMLFTYARYSNYKLKKDDTIWKIT